MSRFFEQNRLLASLPEGDLKHLVPGMQDIRFESASSIYEANEPITHVYFPLTGIISLIVVGEDGSGLEAATVGNEGVIGLGGLLAGDVSFTRQLVQLDGTGVRIARAPFLAAVNRSSLMRRRLAAHSDAFAAQLMQSAACNAQHSVEQRLARWLLTASDRSGERDLPFTHQALAEMLGVQRPTVTLAARMMQSAGLIDYRRGTITVRDRTGLGSRACDCYAIIKRAYDQALGAHIVE
jgi:CRP-like cAMP-binding protein